MISVLTLKKVSLYFWLAEQDQENHLCLKTLYADLPLRLGDIQVAGFNIREIKSNRSSASHEEKSESFFKIFNCSPIEPWVKISLLS